MSKPASPMIRRSLTIACALFALTPAPAALADFTTTFENVGLNLDSYRNNAGSTGAFNVDGNRLSNSYNPTYDAWSGFALSTMRDKTTPGYENQYSSITGSGAGGSQTYAVGFNDSGNPAGSTISLAPGMTARSIAITNTTYAYDAFRDGDPYGFSPKFQSGDFQQLQVVGVDAAGRKVGEVDVYLASFFGSTLQALNSWVTVDLSGLAGATSLQFGVTSSRNNSYGILTPAYFAVDNLTVTPFAVPEPASLVMVASGLGLAAIALRRKVAA